MQRALSLLAFLVVPLTAAPVPPLSPEDELKTIELPEGYRLELVLSDPRIAEPVLCAFDGNGRMYVAEMRSYMQDIDGRGQLDPVSRISRHSSSKGDGVFDKSEVFLDQLLLPRMVLPMDERVLVGLSNSNNLTLHRDADGDGRADESSLWFRGGFFGGNVEHQPSGLVWALDNWIYTTFNNYRLRWNGSGKPLLENTAANGGQWGLAQDDHGKLWWSSAGGEKGIWNYQTPILYGAINVPSQMSPDFNKVWPLVALGDVQGGPARFQSPEFQALNAFTASCGQTVFRGDRLPAELRGNVFLPEPVGRLIRRATVRVEDGITQVANPHGRGEFLRSSDPYFRPVNVSTGPDGCLYIVDMYRGIMDEGSFTRRGSFLRERILEHGLDRVTSRGRIWRLVHKDYQPGPQPRMLDETPAQWVAHLAHPNGWWRDTAQRLLVLKGDKSVLPALREMASSHADPLARIHALWTIEGLGDLDSRFALERLRDPLPQVRVQAIRASETILKTPGEHRELLAALRGLAGGGDPEVLLQVIMTSRFLDLPDWEPEARKIIEAHPSAGVRRICARLFSEAPVIAASSYTPQQHSAIKRGQQIFSSLCSACHGSDGEGTPMAGSQGLRLAPPLKGALTAVQGDDLLRVLLHGLTGPVDGKSYGSDMIAMGSNPDAWIADVASYVRVSFGNKGTPVTEEEVARLRAATGDRVKPWTIAELRAVYR